MSRQEIASRQQSNGNIGDRNAHQQGCQQTTCGLLRALFGSDAAPLRKAGDQRPAYVQSHLSGLQQRLAPEHDGQKRRRLILVGSVDATQARHAGGTNDRFFLTGRHSAGL